MSLFYFLLYLASISFIFVSIYIFYIDRHSRSNMVFSFLYILISLWFISFMILAPSSVKGSPRAWLQYFTYICLLIGSFSFHFAVLHTKNKKLDHWPLLTLIHIPGLYFAIKGFIGLLTWNEQTWLGNAWIEQGKTAAPLLLFFVTACILFLEGHDLMIGMWGKKSGRNREKKQAGYYFWGCLIFHAILGLIFLFAPIFKSDLYPILIISITIVLSWHVWFIIIKFKFMNAGHSIVAGEILDNINEIVIILNSDLRIITVNNKFPLLLSISKEEARNKLIFDIMNFSENVKEKIDQIIKGKFTGINCRIIYKHEPDPVITDSYISVIADQYSDTIGILIISKENKGKKQMKIAFNITGREFEIIELCATGKSNREIGVLLCITERTVESHMHNIYQKTGVENKMGLLNLAYEFNLILKSD